MRMRGLSLFSGIGGIDLALQEYVRPVAYCEVEPYCQAVLLERMNEGALDNAYIFPDIRQLTAERLKDAGAAAIDIITGGFPCQDISVAGRGAGLEGQRSGLFYQVCRLVEEVGPSFVFLENVPAIRTRGLREVVRTLTDLGYDCRWTRLSAASVGAPHRRERWFLLAHTNSQRSGTRWCGEEIWQRQPDTFGHGGWDIEPDVGRVVNGIPARVDRIRCLGNAVVPQQVKEAFERLIGLKPQEANS